MADKKIETLQQEVTALRAMINDLMATQKLATVNNTNLFNDIKSELSQFKDEQKNKTTVKKEPTSTGKSTSTAADIAISKKFNEKSVKSASDIPKLKEESGLVINGELFRQKFGDYLEALGLKKAVDNLHTNCIDLTGEDLAEQLTLNKSKIAELTKEEEHRERWHRAYTCLKASIQGNLYMTLVTRPNKTGNENFFTLWDRVNQLIGGIGSKLELENLTSRWENLEMKNGQRLSEVITEIDEISCTVEAISEDTKYSNTQKKQ